MSKKAKHIGSGIIAFIFLITAVLVFLPIDTTKKFKINEYRFASDYYIELEDMPVMSQETDFTCFVVSMAIVRNFFDLETSENSLLIELEMLNLNEGILPREYISYVNKALDPLSYSVSLINPKSQTEILNTITESLENGLPVIFFYAAPDDWKKPEYNTHYGIIYGIDMRNKIVKISNPYGYFEELSFVELFEGLSFQSFNKEPFLFHLGRIFGYVKSNNIFVLESFSAGE